MLRHATTAVVLFVALLATAPRADAITIHAPDDYAAQRLFQQWADEAAQHVPMPDVPVRVRLRRCSKPESAGAACTHVGRWGQIIDLPAELASMKDADPQWSDMALRVRLLFLHELGHVADLRPADSRPWRPAFRGIFGLRAALGPLPDIGFKGLDPWLLAYTPANKVARSMEWFADAYAACAVWPHEPIPADLESGGGYDYNPTPEQHARACRVVRAMRLR